MVKLNYTERLGLSKEVLKFIESRRTELTNAGIDPAKLAQNLKTKIEVNVERNDKQEKAKENLKMATDAVIEADRDMYVTASSYIDVLSGALMKNSAASKVLRRLRSKAKMPPKGQTVPAV